MPEIFTQGDGPFILQAEGGRPIMMDALIDQVLTVENQRLPLSGRENRPVTEGLFGALATTATPTRELAAHRRHLAIWRTQAAMPRERPRISKSIVDAITESTSILELPDNWDDEGSSRYELAVWEKATNFLKRVAVAHREKFGVWVPAPAILAGPEGGIDLNWETEKRRLLVHIPAGEEKPVDFYGDNRAGQVVKGQLPITTDYRWLLMWLIS